VLLGKLLKSGFDQYLVRYVENGGIVDGGITGAVILGRDIETVSHLDPNEINLAETRCLDQASGYAVWVYYQPNDDKLICEYLEKGTTL
jgi:peptidase E